MSRTPFADRYRRRNRHKMLIILGFALLMLVAVIIAVGTGMYNISFLESMEAFVHHISGDVVDVKADHYGWEVRLPRAIAAAVAGGALAIGGAVMQNVTNNPLAEPYTMGVSSAALTGACISMALGVSVIPSLPSEYAVIANAFVFALLPVMAILVVSSFRKLTSVGVILIGIAMMYMFSSISQYIMVTASSETLSDIYNWRIGSLGRMEKNFDDLALMASLAVPLSIILVFCGKRLDLMYAGDRNAKTMGLNAKRFRILVMSLVSLSTAAIVSFTGTIGFIGLVGPHVARVFVGSNNRYLLPCSAFFGASFLILADTIAKVSGAGGLPVGVISSIVGGPLFLYILIRYNKKVWS